MMSGKPEALLAGATGRTGEALLNALLACGRYDRIHQLTNRPQGSSTRHLTYWQLPDPLTEDALAQATAPVVQDVFVMSFADRLHSVRDLAIHSVASELAETVAMTAARAGAQRLFLVCPIAATEQMSDFRHFYAGAEMTLRLTRLPYRSVAVLLPTANEPLAGPVGFWRGLLQGYLSQFRLMLPQGVAPFTPGRFCEAVLRVAAQDEQGIQVYGAQQLHTLLKSPSPT
ncbi:Rossmann-fold NAD(P)-binding domain-containing protein [Chitinimonas naiadis]